MSKFKKFKTKPRTVLAIQMEKPPIRLTMHSQVYTYEDVEFATQAAPRSGDYLVKQALGGQVKHMTENEFIASYVEVDG